VHAWFHDAVPWSAFGTGLAITAGWVAATFALPDPWRLRFCALGFAVLGFSSLLEIGAIATTRSGFYSGFVEVLAQTNAREVREFLAGTGGRTAFAVFSSLLILPFLLLRRLRSSPIPARRGIIVAAGFGILVTPLAVSTVLGYGTPYGSYVHLRVLGALCSGVFAVADERLGASIPTAGVASTAGRPDLLVVIVGESIARRHMAVYGYPRPTTPKLSAEPDLVFFHDAVASRGYTAASLRDAFTMPGTGRTRLPEVLAAAGFDTWWISNQTPFGVTGDPLSGLVRSVAHRVWLDRQVTPDASQWDQQAAWDGVVLPALDDALRQGGGRKAIFVHLMGCHLLYRNRYPPDTPAFSGSLRPMAADRARTVNEYDTCVLYDDSIVAQILDRVRAAGGASAALWFSDHGEDVYDDSEEIGHNDEKPTRAMAEIPFAVWLSPESRTRRPELARDLPGWVNRPFSLADFSTTLADLAGVRFAGWDPRRSLFAPEYQPIRRFVGTHAYDTLRSSR